MSRLLWFIMVATAFILACSLGIAWLEHQHGFLAAFFDEYSGGGSCKWRFRLQPSEAEIRTEAPRHFMLSLLNWALLCWPVGLAALCLSVVALKNGPHRLRVAFLDLVIIASLTYLSAIRAAGAVLEQCR